MYHQGKPFRFDITGLLKRFRSLPVDVDATVTIGLPGLKISARVDDVERRVARELVIRLADRRVLNATECCDNCIDQALKSLQGIRALLVDKQVDLGGRTDSPLYLLMELMAEGIRQFLTFEETIKGEREALHRFDAQQQYLAGLEQLRAHIYRTMMQVAAIADVAIPKIADPVRYGAEWDLDAYVVDRASPLRALDPTDLPTRSPEQALPAELSDDR
jgi:hypothetical protein